jgi:bacteriocin-like protein
MANINDLTPEQMEKARACKNSDELVELAKSEGIELTDDQLDSISGGSWYNCGNETW